MLLLTSNFDDLLFGAVHQTQDLQQAWVLPLNMKPTPGQKLVSTKQKQDMQDGSVGKELAVQAQRPEFDPQKSLKGGG